MPQNGIHGARRPQDETYTGGFTGEVLREALELERKEQQRKIAAQEAAITTAEKLQKICAELCQENSELKRIADSAEKHAQIAEEEAKSAKEDAAKSRRQSRIANILAVIAIIVAVLAWLLPRDDVLRFFSSIIF